MKFTFLFLFLSSISFLSMGQTSADSRLSVRFTTAQITHFETQQSSELLFWNYYLDHSYIIANVGIKTAYYTDLSSVGAINSQTGLPFDVSTESPLLSSFNPLKFDIPLKTDQKQIYKIDNLNVIIFLSKDEIIQSFNELYN